MNYLPFAGYWFYGGADAGETASFYCSWGLLDSAPLVGIIMARIMEYYIKMRNY
jgi:hypothetical protein